MKINDQKTTRPKATLSNIQKLEALCGSKPKRDLSQLVPLDPATYEPDPWEDAMFLYRFFDERHRLLYVGITCLFQERAEQHAKTALWWRHARTAQCELFPSRGMAKCAEAAIIQAEDPIHNGIRKDPPKKPYPPDRWFFDQQGRKWVGKDVQWWAVVSDGVVPATPAASAAFQKGESRWKTTTRSAGF